MSDDVIRAIREIVETWNARKITGRQFTQKDMRYFAEVMNANARMLIARFGIVDPEFWSGLGELASHAGALTTKGAKVFGDGKDVTNL
jgi:hypothetical protein